MNGGKSFVVFIHNQFNLRTLCCHCWKKRREAMTWSRQMLLAAIGLAGATALGGCAYDDGYYGGVSVGSGYYGGGYYDDYWGPGYYGPTYGWYNDYYYPGSGYYVYDRGGRRHRWNEGQQRYWEGRRGQAQQGEHWRGSLARPNEGRSTWQGQRWQGQRQGQSWQGQSGQGWRGRDSAGATASPPVTRSEPRGSWGGGRSGDSGGMRDRRSDGEHWRGTLRR